MTAASAVATNASRAGAVAADLGRERDGHGGGTPWAAQPLHVRGVTVEPAGNVNAVERRVGGAEVQYLDIVVQPLIALDGEVLGAARQRGWRGRPVDGTREPFLR
jgi:hypothetical protein